jgi:predicted mannosyl-3-phosphoglycerate phosphatase (HAD superfamily)
MADILDTTDLLTRIKEGVSKGVRIVNIRSKEAYETLKIKGEIQSLNKQRRKAIEDLGSSVYRLFKHKNSISEESIKTKCIEIAKIEERIGESEEQLRLVHENAQKELGKLKAIAKPRVVGTCECGAEIYEGSQSCSKCFRKVEQYK